MDPLQCNVKHFHVREKFWGYGSYPGRPPSKRTYFGRSACPNPANSLSTAPIPDFFGAAAMQRATFSRARKKNRILSGCRKSVCCILDFLKGPLLRRRRRVDRHRFDGERGDERRERLLARRRRRRVHATAGRADVSGAARLPRACQPRCQCRPHPLAHRAASCPSDAAPVRPASRGVLSRPASRVGGAPGARGARATRAHARRV